MQETPRVPMSFLVVIFVAAIVIGVVIAYFGMRGSIGAGIP
jgi:hypothetical protein